MSPTYISIALRRQVRADAGDRCGYCHSPEWLTGMPLEIEHLLPESAGGLTIRENLWLACHRCNEYKGARVQALDPVTGEYVNLYNPRTQTWRDHFSWSLDGAEIIGVTSCGRATIKALQLNNVYVVEARRFWNVAGWHPPVEDM